MGGRNDKDVLLYSIGTDDNDDDGDGGDGGGDDKDQPVSIIVLDVGNSPCLLLCQC